MSESLAAVEEAGKPMLRVLRADNPSPMTFTGTMSYLLGVGEVVLIDPGPDLAPHRRAILDSLEPGERIVAILATHAHADHVAGMGPMQAATGAPSSGFGPAGSGRSATMRHLAAQGLPDSGEGFDPRYHPDRFLADGEVIAPAGFPIEVLHTPGHTGCSLSFAIGDWLFTGDLVMGWASSLIAPPDGDLGDYMASLDRLMAHRWSRLYPGHGAPIEEPGARLAELAAHRRDREAQIRAALASGPNDIPSLTRAIYTDTPPTLVRAAERNVLAHLIDLCARGLARAEPAPLPDARYALA